MYKTLLLLFFFGHHAAPVFAQDENGTTDSLFTMVEPAGGERNRTNTFDRIGEPLPVVVRTVSKRVVDSLKAADDFWYANKAQEKKADKSPTQGKNFLQEKWFRSLLWMIILSSFIGVVIWYLVSSNIFVFRKSAKPIGNEEGREESGDDIFSIQYENEIAAATSAGNYRLAVRLWYLQILKLLAEKGMIDYRSERTNQDYVKQLNWHPQHRFFFRLTRHFEYTWYGQFPLSAEAYEKMRADFVHFQNSLQ